MKVVGKEFLQNYNILHPKNIDCLGGTICRRLNFTISLMLRLHTSMNQLFRKSI